MQEIIKLITMRNKFLQMFLLLVLSLMAYQANAQKDMQSDYYNYEVTSIGVGQDGTKILLVTVEAKKIDDGIELAKRNAIAACLFKGVEASGQTEKIPALVPQGITGENQEFFNDFLKLKDKKSGGKYLRFVTRTGNQKAEKNNKNYKVSLEVQVSYNALRDYMVSEGMAKSLNFLF